MATEKNTTDTRVDTFMEEILSGTKDEWKDFIVKEYPELHGYLKEAVTELGLVDYYKAETRRKVLPSQANQILAALNYCKPEEVKVIILGHDPARGYCKYGLLATGLAFSFPQGMTEEDINNMIENSSEPDSEPGRSVRDVHTALKEAKIKPGESCCHEHWAKRGVLLLNACLTIIPNNTIYFKPDAPGEIENPHFKHWKSFIYNLLLRLLQKIDKERKDFPPVYVLCWGTHARDVGRILKGSQGEWNDDHAGLLKSPPVITWSNSPPVIAIGHHPTFPKMPYGKNNFITQATNQFTAIKGNPSYRTLFNEETEEERITRRKKKEEEERRKKEKEEEEKEERRKKKVKDEKRRKEKKKKREEEGEEEDEGEEEEEKEEEEEEEEEEDHQDDVNQLPDAMAGLDINKSRKEGREKGKKGQ